MTANGNRRKRERERGAALVEAAFTIPLLLLVAVSIFEFGRAFEVWQIMTNAAREGARVAVLPGSTETTIKQRVNDYLTVGMSSAEADKATVDITSDEALGSGPGTGSRVTVSYPFQFFVLQPVANLVVSGSSLGAPVTLTTSAMMRNEAP